MYCTLFCRFQAVDGVGAVSSILTVTIYLCACSGNGVCLDGQWNQVTQDFYLAECLCNTGYSGKSIVNISDAIMCAMTSQITSVSIVYSTACSGADQRKHQSSASLAFVGGIHQWPVNSSHKGPVTRKMFPFDDVIMILTYLLPRMGAQESYINTMAADGLAHCVAQPSTAMVLIILDKWILAYVGQRFKFLLSFHCR